MKVLIIEDEILGSETLESYLKDIDAGIHVSGITESIDASVEWLNSNPVPDLILMDIELADGQSFEIFKRVEVKSPVIFTTSYDEFALKAFKVNSIDYLLKPIKKEELKRSIDKHRQLKHHYSLKKRETGIESLLKDLRKQQSGGYRSRFLVKQGQRLISVDTKDIAFFFADGRLCYFRTSDKVKYVIDYTLDELESILDPSIFRRVNRSFIININSIQQIHTYFNNKLKLELKPETEKELLIGREHVAGFKKWLGK